MRAVYDLACREPGAVVQTRDVAAAQGLRESYLAKVIQSLVRARLLRTVRGSRGGVALARPAAEISVREVLEAVEGPIELHRCAAPPGSCQPDECGTHDLWAGVESLLTTTLEQTDFEALARRGRAKTGGTRVAGASLGR